jgi:hypothetical protein
MANAKFDDGVSKKSEQRARDLVLQIDRIEMHASRLTRSLAPD